MKRLQLTLLFTFIIKITWGQYNQDYRVGTRNPQLDKLNSSFEKVVISKDVDSLFSFRHKLADGEKIIYWDSLRQRPHIIIYTKSGFINGPFYCYNFNGILTTVGNYYNDSLWTFMNGYFLLHDTTFKVGLWRYYALQDQFDSTYYSAFTIDRQYKVPIKDSDNFVQEWRFLNGQLWEKRVYKKTQGLVEERIFNKDGSNYSDFEILKNCSIHRKWDGKNNLKDIYIVEKNQRFINLINDETYYKVSQTDQLSDEQGNVIQLREYYDNGNLKEFFDVKAGIKIKYNDKGQVTKIEKRKGVKVSKM